MGSLIGSDAGSEADSGADSSGKSGAGLGSGAGFGFSSSDDFTSISSAIGGSSGLVQDVHNDNARTMQSKSDKIHFIYNALQFFDLLS